MSANDMESKGFFIIKLGPHHKGNKGSMLNGIVIFTAGMEFSHEGFGCYQSFESLALKSCGAVVDDMKGIW